MGVDGVVLREKLRRPEPRGLIRERLHRRILAPEVPPLSLVVAPPGAGKTTLLGAVADQSGPAGWYRASSDDRSEAALIRHLGQALFPQALPGPAAEPPWHAAADPTVALVTALEEARIDRCLVIDDVHELAGAPAETALERFVALRPREVRIVLGSRRPPELNVSRLLVSDELSRVDGDDLRFRSWEVEELFRDVYRQPLSPSTAAALTRRTGGWAAGLQLFHLASATMTRNEREQAVEDLSGRSRLIRSYLTRNVLQGLDAERFRFLLTTCTLGELTGELCDQLLGTVGSAEVLDDLESQQFFTAALADGRTYRYHQVLQTHLEVVLIDRLGAPAARELYARSGELLAAAGRTSSAIRAYASAEDWASVARLLARIPAPSLGGPGVPAGAPGFPEALSDDPILGVVVARRLVRHGRFADAVAAYQHVETLVDDPEFGGRCADEREAAAAWLPVPPASSGPLPRGGPRGLRLARELRRLLQTAAEPGESEFGLLRGLRRWLAGDLDGARHQLERSLGEQDAGTSERLAARLLIEVLRDRTDGADPAGRLEELQVEADLQGLPWLSGLIRCVQVGLLLVQQTCPSRFAACAELLAECEHGTDLWTFALAHAVVGTACAQVGRDDLAEEPLTVAEQTADRLGAPVVAVWVAAQLVALRHHRADAPGPDTVDAAHDRLVRRATTLGIWGAVHPATIATSAESAVDRTIRLRCLGGFAFSCGNADVGWHSLRPRARGLLMLLVLTHGEAQHRERLIAQLWPDATLSSGTRSLQVAVSSIRQCLVAAGISDQVLRRTGDSYVLIVPGAEDQLRRFESVARRADRLLRTAPAAEALAAVGAAVDAYAGDLLPEVGPAEWVVADRDRFRCLTARLAAEAARLAISLGDPGAATGWARRSVELDAYHDVAWQLLAEAYRQLGDESAAAVASREHARIRADLGVTVRVALPKLVLSPATPVPTGLARH